MTRSFLYPALGLILTALRFLVAPAALIIERMVEIWPQAFPATAPWVRTLGDRLSPEDGKPLARRIRAYHHRVADRHDHDRRAVPGLILAV